MFRGSFHTTPSADPRLADRIAPRWTHVDRDMMARAIRAAWGGVGRTGGNPMVGAVVVADGSVVASAFHRQAGIAHAETVALGLAGERARGATLYASLEPCSHHGRTPPCVDGIVDAGIERVVVAFADPDARVRGRGIETLRSRGVRVDVGCLAESACVDNLAYLRDRLGAPATVTLKIALSADGMVTGARGRRDEVTGVAARRDAHALRAAHDAVVVGIETALVDEPRLDCRLLDAHPDHDPVPVVLDTALRLRSDNVWSRSGRTFIVVTGPGVDADRASRIEAAGGRVIRCPAGAGGVDVEAAFEALRRIGLSRLLVEGGPRVFASVVQSGAWDAMWVYRSPRVLGSAGVPLGTAPEAAGRRVDVERVGADERVRVVNTARFDPVLERIRGFAR